MGIALLRVVITYDIICQWSKNFRKRMQNYPENMQIPETTQVDVAIPSWHINGHGDGCWTNFNLSYMEGAGRTVSEDIKTTWAGTNQLAPSVREMGLAARHDTLNDQWNGWNFRKIVEFRMAFFWLFNSSPYSKPFGIRNVVFKTLQRRFHIEHPTIEVFTLPGLIHMDSIWNPWNPSGIPCGIHGITVG